MAYAAKNLELLSGGGANISIWGYTSTDTANVIDADGYFNQASSMLKVGDVIHVHADTDGSPAFGQMVVNKNVGGVVDVADMNALATSDTR